MRLLRVRVGPALRARLRWSEDPFNFSMQAKSAGRQNRGLDPIDIHVAMRVRERRIELGITQPKLAAELGITFQNLYKYEKAKIRISAGRLYRLSKALEVPVAFFFEGLAGPI